MGPKIYNHLPRPFEIMITGVHWIVCFFVSHRYCKLKDCCNDTITNWWILSFMLYGNWNQWCGAARYGAFKFISRLSVFLFLLGIYLFSVRMSISSITKSLSSSLSPRPGSYPTAGRRTGRPHSAFAPREPAPRRQGRRLRLHNRLHARYTDTVQMRSEKARQRNNMF